ncbi:MAG: hypothetical protein JXA67_06565 [Micromonosporaceae bacterium]|nr:hypothetical protein [Micromonosporaceae bacterium]
MAVGPRVLIGHSLGSVVAYEYVRQHRDAELPLLLTLGSPLGLRVIRGSLGALEASPDSAAEGRQRAPARWVNIYDPGDPVACAGGLGSWWPHVADEQVDNGGDAHAVTRYLCTRAVGRAVVSALHDGE